MLEYAVFGLLGLLALTGGGMIVFGRRPATNAMGFLVALLSLAGLFALLHQSFLFFAQLMVSVGGVVVVTLITVMTVNLQEARLPKEPSMLRWVLGAIAVLVPVAVLLYRALTDLGGTSFPEVPDAFGGSRSLGTDLFADWVLPFEILSILLLTAMIGAIIIGNKEQSYDRKS